MTELTWPPPETNDEAADLADEIRDLLGAYPLGASHGAAFTALCDVLAVVLSALPPELGDDVIQTVTKVLPDEVARLRVAAASDPEGYRTPWTGADIH